MKRWLALTFLHLRFVSLSFWRNPSAAFFSIAFPLMFLTINSLLLGANTVPIGGQMVLLSAYYVAAMSTFAVIMTCFTNLAASILFDRDQGRLKRLRGTPTPVSAYLAARVLFAAAVAMLACGLCIAIGVLFFQVRPNLAALPLFFAVVALGAGVFAALALAIVGAIPNAQAGPAVLNALTFPILFISSVFYPMQNAPAWLGTLAGVLPAHPLASAVTAAFFGLGVASRDLLVLAAWGVAGSLLAVRFFRWQPMR
jgi:ABC-2 type transport system permease protein